jgi:transcriptional regulator GlxA family with amidase domain
MKISFLIMPQVNLLDLGCITHVFLEAQQAGLPCEMVFCATEKNITTSVNLPLGQIIFYTDIQLLEGDYVIVISSYHQYILSKDFKPHAELIAWLHTQHKHNIVICSLCNAAFLLAKAGLLDGKKCTTNWLRIEALRAIAPKAKIIENILFCEDNGILTGAGGTACFDLGLHIIHELAGDKMVYAISRRLVLYNRRSGHHDQISVFMKYRNHVHIGIHQVQDWLTENIDKDTTLGCLAEIANMSERNFTRIFKKETGLTVKQYVTEIRKEKASELSKFPDMSKIQIANECGLRSDRQLRRILNHQKL